MAKDMKNSKGVKTKKRVRLTPAEKIVSIISVLLIVGSVVAVGYVYLMNSKIFTIDDPQAGSIDSSIVSPKKVQKKSVNVLVCGIDYLEGGSRAKLTDVIMVANMDFINKKVNILQIPRDTFIGNEYSTGKINAIYSSPENGGITGLANKINNMFLIPIDYYATINMTGFRGIVNAVGGVEVDSPVAFTLEGVTIQKGKQKLNGKQADRFVRNRKGAGYAAGDLMRNQMQQIFLKALMEKMFALNFKDIAAMAPTIIKDVSTDMTLNQMLEFYKQVSAMGSKSVNFHTLEVSGAYNGSYSVVSLHAKPTADMLNENFRAHSKKYTWEELGITELVTDYPYTPKTDETTTTE